MSKNEKLLSIMALVLMLALVLLLLDEKEDSNEISKYKYKELSRVDTTFKVEPSRSIKDTTNKARIQSKGDTIYQTKAFLATYKAKLEDNRVDSIQITYSYPDNTFTYEISLKADTVKTLKETVLKTETIEEPNAWYESLWFSVTSGVLGLIAGVYIAK